MARITNNLSLYTYKEYHHHRTESIVWHPGTAVKSQIETIFRAIHLSTSYVSKQKVKVWVSYRSLWTKVKVLIRIVCSIGDGQWWLRPSES
jgi:hypothetical protein